MPKQHRRYRAFTLVEVLATLLLIAIVMPAVMQGVSIGLIQASTARQRTEAAAVAQTQMAMLLASGQWSGGVLAGDILSNGSTYHWQGTVQSWSGDTTSVGLQQLDVSVTWLGRTGKQSITLSTITYDRTGSTSL